MAGQVQHLEAAVAEIDDVAFLDDARRPRRAHAVAGERVAGMGQGGDQGLAHIVAGHAQHLHFAIGELRCHEGAARRRLCKTARLQAMHQAIVELMVAAHMIGVGMGGDGRDRLVDQRRDGFPQAHDAHAGVDQQVPVAAAQMPDIAAHERDDMGLPQQGDVVADAASLEPAFGDLQGHRSFVRLLRPG